MAAPCVPGEPDTSCCPDWDALDGDIQEKASALAWSSIRLLTGGLVGNCETVFRPCVDEPCSACSPYLFRWMYPHIEDGRWVNSVCGGSGCSCPSLSEIVLPGLVASVASVTEDGVALDGTVWRLDGNRIVRLDGGRWPACQDMRLPEDAPGALVVRYIPGVEADMSALAAVGVLACEFSKACSGAKCRLPSSVTSISRQGVTMDLSSGMFPDGLTGIREVDAYILSINPHALKVPPLVWSPDNTRGRYTSSTAP